MNRRRLLPSALPSLALLAALALPAPALAAEKSASGKAAPMRIEADRMHLNHARRIAVFTGHVRLVRGDFQLDCDRLTARYRAAGGIETARAAGHVRIRQGEARGHAERALLDEQAGIVKLMDHAVLEQQGRRIEGDLIVHDMNAGDTQVLPAAGEGGQKRARMIIEDDGTKP